MSKTKSGSRSDKRNNVVEFFKRKKAILIKRKASWRDLFHKYSQPVKKLSSDVEINLTTLMPEKCNILNNNISKDKIAARTESRNINKVATNVTHKKYISEPCHTKMIWSISSTGTIVALINILSNKTISVKKQYVEDSNLVSNTELKGSKTFVIQTQAFDSD